MTNRLTRPNLKTVVADFVRERIFSGELRPGDHIDQDAIAEQLGVSKLPVREALIALESEALIENVARRGSFVAALSPDDVLDHYRIYGAVSAVAAKRAAGTLNEQQITELDRIVKEMEILANGGVNRVESARHEEDLNFEFHRIVNQAGGSARLLSVLHLLYRSIPRHFYSFTVGWGPAATEHHKQIVDALRKGDGDEAAAAMTAHLEESGELAVRMLTETGFWGEP